MIVPPSVGLAVAVMLYVLIAKFASTFTSPAGTANVIVLPLVLFDKILKETNYKKILILATGSLHSPLMVNLKKTLPSITHAVSIEVMK